MDGRRGERPRGRRLHRLPTPEAGGGRRPAAAADRTRDRLRAPGGVAALSLRLRLALFGAGVVALAVAIFGALIFTLAGRAAGPDQDAALKRRAESAAAVAGASPPATGLVAPVDPRTFNEVFVEGLDRDGVPIFSTGQVNGAAPVLPASLLRAAGRNRGAFATTGSGSARLRADGAAGRPAADPGPRRRRDPPAAGPARPVAAGRRRRPPGSQ